MHGERNKSATQVQLAVCILIRRRTTLLQIIGRKKAVGMRLLEPANVELVCFKFFVISNSKPFPSFPKSFFIAFSNSSYFELFSVSPASPR